MARRELTVVALGGNAISRPDEEGNVDQQFANSRATAVHLVDLVARGQQLVITHGNGPQIGNFLLRNEAARNTIYPLPMEVAVAHVQGGMGFMIAQTLTNELTRRGIERIVTAVITTVLVDQGDASFAKPTKPVGLTLSSDEAERLRRHNHDWVFKEVAAGQFRRVVPSPAPQKIMEIEHIRRAVAAGETLVVCGGGGIPVVRDPEDGLRGVRAVIDKDLAGALLAADLHADAMLILTNTERVCLHFGTPHQKAIERLTCSEAERYLAQGQFPTGSMGPKIQGALAFLRAGSKPDARVIIGPLHRAADAIAGRTGTSIVPD